MSQKPFVTYKEAVNFLFDRINYERTDCMSKSLKEVKLQRMVELLHHLGNPHQQTPVVHIAGTKGKGSTAVMLASILTSAGYRTGLTTSPHQLRVEERFQVDCRLPTEAEFLSLVNKIQPAVAKMLSAKDAINPTFFELTTALAWLHFRQKQCDLAVVEVGLGGRLDSTNVCHPIVCIITNVSLDHTEILGKSVELIAREKGGIIKPNIPVISGVSQTSAKNIIQELCNKHGSKLKFLGSDIQIQNVKLIPVTKADFLTSTGRYFQMKSPLPGQHQLDNLGLVLGAVESLKEQGYHISNLAIKQGLSAVQWPLRIEVISRNPDVIVDAAHNHASIAALCDYLKQNAHSPGRLIFGASHDKDVRTMFSELSKLFDDIVVTHYTSSPRAIPAEKLASLAEEFWPGDVICQPTLPKAWKAAIHQFPQEGLICITGSFFLASELREHILSSGKPSFTQQR